MATQLKASDYQHITVPGTPPQHIRVAFVGGKAVKTVDDAMSRLPDDVRGQTLDQLNFRSMTEQLIATAKEHLSHRMFGAFLRWGETASHFSTRYETDEDGNSRCEVASSAIHALCDAPAHTIQDVLLRTYLLSLEVADCPAFGSFKLDVMDLRTQGDRLAATGASDALWLSPVARSINEVAGAAWGASDPKLLAIDPVIGSVITSAFSYARGVYATESRLSRHRSWLDERNAIMAVCNSDEAKDDEAHEHRLSRLNELDHLILETPASSQEDVIAQLVLATQISAEGSCIAENGAAKLIRRCAELTGQGSLAGAVKELAA